jgi:allantoicase
VVGIAWHSAQRHNSKPAVSVTVRDELVNLASERLGARASAANDEFFAAKENLVRDADPIAKDEYTEAGKWMDGWETRRRRDAGHDWCVIRLGARGRVRELVIDTTHFKGNHPPECSVDALDSPVPDTPGADAAWSVLLERSPLTADSANSFRVSSVVPATHLRLNIYPDGGVARLRALGQVVPDIERLRAAPELNLAAAEHGAVVVLASDMFFGDRQNLIMPGAARSMREGWETRRRRGPGHDWAIVRLAARGTIARAEVDTSWFKGNAPASCSLDAIDAADVEPTQLITREGWARLLAETPLSPNVNHVFDQLQAVGDVTHVRLNIFPDGGVSRLRLWGDVSGSVG